MDLIFYIGIGVMVASLVALACAPLFLRPARHERRLLEVVKSERPDQRKISEKELVREKVLALARALHSRIGFAGDDKLKGKLLSAGLRGSNKMDAYMTARVVAPLAGIAGGSFLPGSTLMWCMVFGGIGYLLPDILLTRMVKRRQKRMQKSIPDAIDLLVICVDAGLGLDQALLRIGQEIKASHRELHEEFMQINLEQRAGKPRLDAWQSLADRTKLQEFASLVTMLTQTDRFGTPIVRALSHFAEEIRTKRRQRAEEAAAKTKIKILFPLVLFIFPCIFIVLIGPAVLQLMQTLGQQ
ncbi:MAG: type II secretion system F family protein [Acidobacteriaceae bacterium]|nr:type II secretion system F family protein [Acidobacteriaceae bacterium]